MVTSALLMPQSQKCKMKWQKREDGLKNFCCSGGIKVFSSNSLLVVNTRGKRQVIDLKFHLSQRLSIKEEFYRDSSRTHLISTCAKLLLECCGRVPKTVFLLQMPKMGRDIKALREKENLPTLYPSKALSPSLPSSVTATKSLWFMLFSTI